MNYNRLPFLGLASSMIATSFTGSHNDYLINVHDYQYDDYIYRYLSSPTKIPNRMRLNQRQKRKNRRRAHAAGDKAAYK